MSTYPLSNNVFKVKHYEIVNSEWPSLSHSRFSEEGVGIHTVLCLLVWGNMSSVARVTSFTVL